MEALPSNETVCPGSRSDAPRLTLTPETCDLSDDSFTGLPSEGCANATFDAANPDSACQVGAINDARGFAFKQSDVERTLAMQKCLGISLLESIYPDYDPYAPSNSSQSVEGAEAVGLLSTQLVDSSGHRTTEVTDAHGCRITVADYIASSSRHFCYDTATAIRVIRRLIMHNLTLAQLEQIGSRYHHQPTRAANDWKCGLL